MKSVDLKGDISYTSPIRKSDHVLMDMEVMGMIDRDTREKHRESRRNYERANFVELRSIFL